MTDEEGKASVVRGATVEVGTRELAERYPDATWRIETRSGTGGRPTLQVLDADDKTVIVAEYPEGEWLRVRYVNRR